MSIKQIENYINKLTLAEIEDAWGKSKTRNHDNDEAFNRMLTKSWGLDGASLNQIEKARDDVSKKIRTFNKID